MRRNKSIIAQFETHVPYTNRKSANLLDIHFFHAHPALPLSTPSFHDLSYFLWRWPQKHIFISKLTFPGTCGCLLRFRKSKCVIGLRDCPPVAIIKYPTSLHLREVERSVDLVSIYCSQNHILYLFKALRAIIHSINTYLAPLPGPDRETSVGKNTQWSLT